MSILINDITKKQLDNFIQKPTQALGIFGSIGMGKKFVAKYIAGEILGKSLNENSPELHIVRPEDKSSITIEQARQVSAFLKLKSGKSNAINRIVIITDAHLMTNEAQNSLLKILEETPKDSLIILTAINKNKLLPTVLSRLSKIKLGFISKSQIIDYYKNTKDIKEIEKVWKVSGGRIGLMDSIFNNNEHQLLAEIKQAKTLLSNDNYQRLILVENIAKNNPVQFIDAMQIVSDFAFNSAVEKADKQLISKLHKIRLATLQAKESLQKNANAKLVITNLILSI